MPPFKPPGLKLGIDIEATNTFDAQVRQCLIFRFGAPGSRVHVACVCLCVQSTFPSMADSLQISEGAATRLKDDDQYSVEVL